MLNLLRMLMIHAVLRPQENQPRRRALKIQRVVNDGFLTQMVLVGDGRPMMAGFGYLLGHGRVVLMAVLIGMCKTQAGDVLMFIQGVEPDDR
jgi:hypothetical protein